MRIQSIKEVNTQQQENPFLVQKVGSVAAGESASLVSFKECLRLQIQDIKAPVDTQKAELVAASTLWNYMIPRAASPRPGMKPKARAYLSLSDL